MASVGSPRGIVAEQAESPGADRAAGLRIQILGSPRIWRDGADVDIGPRQQAILLAVLSARAGRPVSTAELVDVIWGEDAPASALNVVQKYVGTLRRLLEPWLHARESGSHLLRRGASYHLVAGPDELDVVDFRRGVAAAAAAVADRRHEAALDHYAHALGLWNGPAGDGLAPAAVAAAPIFAALNDEFFSAATTAAELAVSLGRPERVLGPLHLAAAIAPLHEPVQAALVTVLGAAGRQVEALSVFRAVRTRLVRELGLDPSPTLEHAHQRVLSRALPDGASGGLARHQVKTSVAATSVGDGLGGLVGRADELGALRSATEKAAAGGTALVIVEGEPGVGKTRLLEEAAAHHGAPDALVVWGSCFEGEGTPSMWPWVQAVGAVLAALPTDAQKLWRDGDLGRLVEPTDDFQAGSVMPDSGTQFRLFDRVVDVIREVSAQRPIVVVIDDLHWADVASLQLFSHVAARLPAGTVLIGALRDRAPSPGTELAHLLASASRVPGHRRIRLGSLAAKEVAELVRRETGGEPDALAILRIHERTGGNPFFVRELSRFLAGDGPLAADSATRPGVPSTVRDVIKDRVTVLDDDCKTVLHTASLVGREVGLALLARAVDLDIGTCLDLLGPLEAFGLVERTPANPFTCRFSHDLVRESLAEIMPSWQANHVHLRIASALEAIASEDDSDVERLAYHLWSAGPLADAARTANALVRAAGRAANKSALESAERHLRLAVDISRQARLPEEELAALSQLTAVVGMRSMYATSDLDLLERAENLARGLGREMQATAFLYSRWVAHAQGIQLDRSEPLARRLLEQGRASSDPIVQAYGLQSWGIVQWHLGNIDEAINYLGKCEQTLLANVARHDEDPVRRDLHLLMTGVLAEVTALHGDVEAATGLLDTLEAAAGENPYQITVWASIAARISGIVGDTDLALRASRVGIAADPGFSFVYLGTYQRLARCWALAVTGEERNPSASVIPEAERLIAENLLDPPRSCVATWSALLAEMYLACGSIDDAAAAVDRAASYLDAYGQRYPEGLVLLLRARVLHARGEPVSVVRGAAEAARTLSVDRGAGLFAQRADELLAALG